MGLYIQYDSITIRHTALTRHADRQGAADAELQCSETVYGADGLPDAKDGTVESVRYDGFGNRQSESRGETTVTHTYDGRNRITASFGGDVWDYDANGNVTEHTWGNTYDAAGRTLTTVSKTNNGPRPTSATTTTPPATSPSPASRAVRTASRRWTSTTCATTCSTSNYPGHPS